VQKICLLCFYLVKNQVWGFQRWKGPLYLVAMGVLSVLIFIITLVPFPVENEPDPVEIHCYVFFTLIIMTMAKIIQVSNEKEINKNFFSLLPLSYSQLFLIHVLYDIISPRSAIVLALVLSFCLRYSSNLLIFMLSLFYFVFFLLCFAIWMMAIFKFLRILIPHFRQYANFIIKVVLLCYFTSVLILKVDLDIVFQNIVLQIKMPLSVLEQVFRSSTVPISHIFRDFFILFSLYVIGISGGILVLKLATRIR